MPVKGTQIPAFKGFQRKIDDLLLACLWRLRILLHGKYLTWQSYFTNGLHYTAMFSHRKARETGEAFFMDKETPSWVQETYMWSLLKFA